MWPLIVVDMIVGAVLRKLGRFGDACWLVMAGLVMLAWLLIVGLYTMGVVVVGNTLLAAAWLRRQVRPGNSQP